MDTKRLKEHMEDILKELKELKKLIMESNLNRARRSEKINELCSALAKAQGAFEIATKNKTNLKRNFNSEKYSDLTAIVNASRPHLADNELAIIQSINEHKCGANYLHTMLTHSSGQWIESIIKLVPSENTIEAVESNMICMRRHAYAALIGVIIEDEDDDGDADSAIIRQEKEKGTKLNTQINMNREQAYETITKEQLEELRYELKDYKDITKQILDGMNIDTLANLPKDKFITAIRRVREIIQTRDGK